MGDNPWPHNPDGYCWTCEYKVSKKHNSGTFFKGKDCPNHKEEATRKNTMGSSTENAGYRNSPNGKWQGEPAGEEEHNLVNNIKTSHEKNSPGCNNPQNVENETAFLDTAAYKTLLSRKAKCKRPLIQKPNMSLGTRSKKTIMMTETLELLLSNLPEEAREAFIVPVIPHKLIAACELVDAGCSIHFYKHGCKIEFEGETLNRGWQDKATRLWRIALTSEGGGRLTPYTTPK